MTGRIREEDIALVRERTRIEEVVGAQIQLRSAGGGSLKGLCPFHDEKTPSFHVTPAKQFFHCFGCQQGGDVLDFVMKVDHLSFTEAVERLAGRAGIQLRYEEGGSAPARQTGRRQRLVEANASAAAFYQEQLETSEAAGGWAFLTARGFDEAAAKQFGVGYAPGGSGWDALTKHLRSRRFTDEELRIAGLARDGQRGLYDRFRNRLVWPIRDLSGDVVGFGARKLSTDPSDDSPKYLNTPETPLYKKSQVLYGLDLAKRDIARQSRAVVVEGYTDVMACHLAGVPTAVATCGTAFGEEHTRVLRRLLMDQKEFRGEVIFTFDGDVAGQEAALRAFEGDQRFALQTFVAVQADGLDPCDLRLAKGDGAVRELVADRVPLFEFAIRSAVEQYDLETSEGAVRARERGMAIVRQIKNVSLRVEYARRLARWTGLEDPNELVRYAHGSVRDVGRQRTADVARSNGEPGRSGGASAAALPDLRDPAAQDEREVLKLAIQHPALVGTSFDGLAAGVFTYPVHLAVRDAIAAAGGAASMVETPTSPAQWVQRVREHIADETARGLVSALAVEPLRENESGSVRYATAMVARLEQVAATRRVTQLKSRLQRLNPVDDPESYNRMFGQLVALEQEQIALRERAISGL